MLVRFKRNWFSPDGVRYKTRDGLAEIGDNLRDQLPKDAEIVDDKGITLPDKGLKPLPGFGAIPQWEQDLADLGAAPTHLITAGAGAGQAPSKGDALDEDGSAKAEAKDRVVAERKADDKTKADAPKAPVVHQTIVSDKKKSDL